MKILFLTDGTECRDCALETIGKFNIALTDEIKVVTVLDMDASLTTVINSEHLPTTSEIELTERELSQRIIAETSEKIQLLPWAQNLV